MKQSPRNIRFEELDSFLRRQGFEGTQRGAHVQYRREDGMRFSVVKPHGSKKTVNQNAVKRILERLELDQEASMATKKDRTLDYYMDLPYTVETKHDEDGWFARVMELPGCMTWADTFEELGPMIEDAMRGWIEDAVEHGDPIPEPRDTKDYSGKVNLRMPKSLHRDLARRAEAEGVSLNQVMVTILAQSVGR
jgi:antitoxin HicB